MSHLRLAAVVGVIVALAIVVLVLALGHGSNGSSAASLVPIHGTVAVVGPGAPSVTAGSPVTILNSAGDVVATASLTYQSQDPAEDTTSFSWNVNVPAEPTYGIEVPGSAVRWYSPQQIGNIVDCVGPGCSA